MKIRKDVLTQILREALVRDKKLIKGMIKDCLVELFSEDFIRRTVVSEMKKNAPKQRVQESLEQDIYDDYDYEEELYDSDYDGVENERHEDEESRRLEELKKNINYEARRPQRKKSSAKKRKRKLTPKQRVAMNTVVNSPNQRKQVAEKLGIKDEKLAEALYETQKSGATIADEPRSSGAPAFQSHVESEIAAANQKVPEELIDESTGCGVDLEKFAMLSDSSGKWGEIAEIVERGGK